MKRRDLCAPLLLLSCLVLFCALCLCTAHSLERGRGALEIRSVRIPCADETGRERTLSARFYLPVGAAADAPVPGVLLLSGRDGAGASGGAWAAELARRGYAALLTDAQGPEAALAAWEWLAEQKDIQGYNMAAAGLSAGGTDAWELAAACSGTPRMPQAVILACGALPSVFAAGEEAPAVFNVLFLQAEREAYSPYRDGARNISALRSSDSRRAFLDCAEPEFAWNTTYGYFGEGTARRMELIPGPHSLALHSPRALAAAIDWLGSSLGRPRDGTLPDTDFLYPCREAALCLAALCVFALWFPARRLLRQRPGPSPDNVRKP